MAEIKKYPKLTEIGSKRLDSEVQTWKSGKTSGVPHSGFYTQEQIKDIVAYATERHITIVPEFEMPQAKLWFFSIIFYVNNYTTI